MTTDPFAPKSRLQWPIKLLEAWRSGRLSREQLRDLLPPILSGSIIPASVLPEDVWLELFQETGFVGHARNGNSPSKPRKPLKLFRGASSPRGFSWTPDLETARKFVRDYDEVGVGPAKVWEATVPPEAVLAVIEHRTRGEREVVVDPRWFDLREASILAV